MSRRRCYPQYVTRGLMDFFLFLNLKVRACSQEQICTVHEPSLTVKSSRLQRWYNIIKAIFSTGTGRLLLIGSHEKHNAENWAACRRRSHFCMGGAEVSFLLCVSVREKDHQKSKMEQEKMSPDRRSLDLSACLWREAVDYSWLLMVLLMVDLLCNSGWQH